MQEDHSRRIMENKRHTSQYKELNETGKKKTKEGMTKFRRNHNQKASETQEQTQRSEP